MGKSINCHVKLEFHGREMLIGVTYLVVVFSLMIQATTLGVLIRRLNFAGTQTSTVAPPQGTDVAAME